MVHDQKGLIGGIDTRSKAVIYPARTVSGYGHIYSLGIAGIPVTAIARMDCENFRSRYVCEKYIVADPHDGPPKFIDWLIQFGCRQETKPVLFMLEDPYAFIISIYHEQLRPFFHYSFIPLETIDVFFNKHAMYLKAAEAGLRVPNTIYSPIGESDIKNWTAFPAVVKPIVSRFNYHEKVFKSLRTFPEVFGGKAVFASTLMEMRNVIRSVENAGLDFCIQEYIPGDNAHLFTVYFVADKNGFIPSFSTHFKVRQYPADFGTTSISQSRSVPLLRDYASRFCKETGYVGPATMEFKQSSSDKLWYLMEINPRLGYSVRRSTIKGVNMPLQQYLLSTGQQLLDFKQDDNHLYWIDIPGDIKGLLWRRKKNGWRLSLLNILKPYFYFREAVFNFKDPFPGAIRLLLYLIHWVKKASIRILKNIFP